eukprot:3572-Heterococcus_DN1.PRE.1
MQPLYTTAAATNTYPGALPLTHAAPGLKLDRLLAGNRQHVQQRQSALLRLHSMEDKKGGLGRMGDRQQQQGSGLQHEAHDEDVDADRERSGSAAAEAAAPHDNQQQQGESDSPVMLPVVKAEADGSDTEAERHNRHDSSAAQHRADGHQVQQLHEGEHNGSRRSATPRSPDSPPPPHLPQQAVHMVPMMSAMMPPPAMYTSSPQLGHVTHYVAYLPVPVATPASPECSYVQYAPQH